MVVPEVEELAADHMVVQGGEAEVEVAPDSEKGMQMRGQMNRGIQKFLRSAWEQEREMEKKESGCVIQVQIIT